MSVELNFPKGLLFSDPRTNQRLGGAKLSFFFAGTSGFTSMYQDAALTNPWAQPIIADANGNFPPNIYFDAFSTVRAKVQLANSANAVQWTVDRYNIPFNVTQDTPCLRYLSSSYDVAIPAPPSPGIGLIINNLPGGVALKLVGGGLAQGLGITNPAWQIGNGTAGTQVATFVATNKPGPSDSGPVKWLPILFNGTVYYTPCFL